MEDLAVSVFHRSDDGDAAPVNPGCLDVLLAGGNRVVGLVRCGVGLTLFPVAIFR